MKRLSTPDPGLRIWLTRCMRFFLLWWTLSVVVMLIFLLEGSIFWLRGRGYKAPSTLDRVWPCDVSVDSRGTWAVARIAYRRNSTSDGTWSDVVLLDLKRREAVSLGMRRLRPRCVAIDNPTSIVAVGCANGTIYCQAACPDETGHTDLWLFVHSGDTRLSRIAFSPDGKRLAAIGRRYVSVWNWPEGRLLQRRKNEGQSKVLCFSADSQQILSIDTSGMLCLWDIGSGDVVATIAAHQGHIANAAWNQGADWVALRTATKLSVRRFGGSERLLWQDTSWLVSDAMDAHGKWIAAVAQGPGRRRVQIYDAQAGRRRFKLEGHKSIIAGLKFANNGCLYSWDFGGEFRAWDVQQQRRKWSFSLVEWAANDGSENRTSLAHPSKQNASSGNACNPD